MKLGGGMLYFDENKGTLNKPFPGETARFLCVWCLFHRFRCISVSFVRACWWLARRTFVSVAYWRAIFCCFLHVSLGFVVACWWLAQYWWSTWGVLGEYWVSIGKNIGATLLQYWKRSVGGALVSSWGALESSCGCSGELLGVLWRAPVVLWRAPGLRLGSSWGCFGELLEVL